MNLKFLLWLFALTILASCENPSNSPLKKSLVLGKPIYLQYQDTLFIESENTWVSFDSLLEDSRCPIGLLCVWAGNAKIGFFFEKDESKVEFSLDSHKALKNDTTIWGYSISLLSVLPYPHRDSSYLPSDYSAEILVTKQ